MFADCNCLSCSCLGRGSIWYGKIWIYIYRSAWLSCIIFFHQSLDNERTLGQEVQKSMIWIHCDLFSWYQAVMTKRLLQLSIIDKSNLCIIILVVITLRRLLILLVFYFGINCYWIYLCAYYSLDVDPDENHDFWLMYNIILHPVLLWF